ncbi:alpha/beta hydrolase [Halarcobacter mediterraneus]|uniref:Alpha/beta hydrolase n=1 Tax=Halarcobacter mediterraneus TaxID=2023153 RepID=A0A4Q1AY34_9BACT|nr:alpha/beta fold hydrolase [Halarcobacter mediterraneus]RXK14263.1 alpha/beta hydrolase [Halarcobacter mediterraneus]
MLKKILSTAVLSTALLAANVTKEECESKDGSFIYAGNECIEYKAFEGEDNEVITVIVHGTWDLGTNTLGRYGPFAETMNMMTDLTTIAVSLPGYSNSSTNKLKPLASKEVKNLAATKEYVNFLGELISSLKEKYEAQSINFIGHSAGAMMGATLSGVKPDLLQNVVLVGGRYDIHEISDNKNLISMIDVLDKVNKNTKYLFIYGTKDEISKPEVTKNFFKVVEKKGLNAKLVEVKGAGHIDLDMTDTATSATIELFEEE